MSLKGGGGGKSSTHLKRLSNSSIVLSGSTESIAVKNSLDFKLNYFKFNPTKSQASYQNFFVLYNN